jgi:hypothetical protein
MDDTPLRLADDLRGHGEHVTVGQAGRRGRDQLRQVVACRDLGKAGDRGDLDPAPAA